MKFYGQVMLEVFKRLLELMPKCILPISVVLACILHPQMNRVIIMPGRKFYRVYWKGKVLFAPSKGDALLFMYPRPFQRWLRIRRGDVIFEGGERDW